MTTTSDNLIPTRSVVTLDFDVVRDEEGVQHAVLHYVTDTYNEDGRLLEHSKQALGQGVGAALAAFVAEVTLLIDAAPSTVEVEMWHLEVNA